jgi:hypothetical protein
VPQSSPFDFCRQEAEVFAHATPCSPHVKNHEPPRFPIGLNGPFEHFGNDLESDRVISKGKPNLLEEIQILGIPVVVVTS